MPEKPDQLHYCYYGVPGTAEWAISAGGDKRNVFNPCFVMVPKEQSCRDSGSSVICLLNRPTTAYVKMHRGGNSSNQVYSSVSFAPLSILCSTVPVGLGRKTQDQTQDQTWEMYFKSTLIRDLKIRFNCICVIKYHFENSIDKHS